LQPEKLNKSLRQTHPTQYTKDINILYNKQSIY
jgi:hypothetical protein